MKKVLLAFVLLSACQSVELSAESIVPTETLSLEALAADESFSYKLNYDPYFLKPSDEFLEDGAHFLVTGGADIWVRTAPFEENAASEVMSLNGSDVFRRSEIKDECRHDYAQLPAGQSALIFHLTTCLDDEEVMAESALMNLLTGLEIQPL